ncbi:hypothetical protein ACTMU2_37275 [Cupriavidus basilensis]
MPARARLAQPEVSSAGLAPPVGAPADPSAVRLLAREGCNLANHRARAIDIESRSGG